MRRRDLLKAGGIALSVGGITAAAGDRAMDSELAEQVELEEPLESLAIDDMLEVTHTNDPEELYQDRHDENLEYVSGELYLNGEITSAGGIEDQRERFPMDDTGTYLLKIDSVYENTELTNRVLFDTEGYQGDQLIRSSSVLQVEDL